MPLIGIPDNASGDPDDDRIVERCLEDQQRLLNELQDERTRTPPRRVYHYSGDIPLYQILQSGHLWLSDYTTLNDPSELSYGIGVGLTVLQQELTARGSVPIEVDFATGLQTVIGRGLDNTFRAFVLSMSVAPDELTQWRSYADGATGYCLGFDDQLLDQAFSAFAATHPHLGAGSFEVIYDSSQLHSRMTAHVTNALSAVARLMAPTEVHLKKLAVNLYFAMIYTALYFKHPAYASEQEYRFLLITRVGDQPSALLRRARRHALIDYLTLDWKTSFPGALQSIKIGPAGNNNANGFITETLRLHLPAQTVIVNQSTIPFRG